MSVYDAAFVDIELSKRTSIFGLHLWVVIGILVSSFIVLTLFLLSLCLTSHSHHRNKNTKLHHPKDVAVTTLVVSKEIQEIVHTPPQPAPEIHVDIGKAEHQVVVYSDRFSSRESKGIGVSVCETTSSFGSKSVRPEVSHLRWGRWYTSRELEAATNGLCEENVIGEGGYGIMYRGYLH